MFFDMLNPRMSLLGCMQRCVGFDLQKDICLVKAVWWIPIE